MGMGGVRSTGNLGQSGHLSRDALSKIVLMTAVTSTKKVARSEIRARLRVLRTIRSQHSPRQHQHIRVGIEATARAKRKHGGRLNAQISRSRLLDSRSIFG